jgi:hypothetical protein
MLFDRRRRDLALECLDIGRDRNRLDFFNMLISGAFAPSQKLPNGPAVGGPGVRVADGTVKNSKNFLRVPGSARAISAGAGKESIGTRANSGSDICR